MDSANVPRSDRALKFINQCFQTIFFADVVAGGEGVSGVKANSKRKLGTGIHDFAQMLEAVSNALPLPRGVLQKNLQTSEPQAAAGKLKTLGAHAYTIRFTRSPRTAWV